MVKIPLALYARVYGNSSNPSFLGVSSYNSSETELLITLFDLLNESKQNYIVCGDLNAKTKSVGCHSSNESGKILDETFLSYNVESLNDNDYTPTYYSYSDTKYSEILDLFICSSSIWSKKLS